MPVSDYTPDPNDVAVLLRSRTGDSGGNEAGIFTDSTTPTRAQVESQIKDVVDEVYPKFGQDIPDALGSEKDALRRTAKRAVVLGAAALVEISFFPEQVATGRSPYKLHQERYEKAVKDVERGVADIAAGDEPGTDDNSQVALGDGFPVDEGGMVGWGTRW